MAGEAMTGPGPDPSRIFGPAAEIGTLWLAELRRRSGTPSIAWSDATNIANRVLEGLGAELDGTREVGRSPLDDLPVGTGLPEIDDVMALRSVLRARAADKLPPHRARPLLDAADALIDNLVSALVRSKLDALESAAFVDPLTGAGNRRALDRDLARELARAFRHGRPVSVAAIDLDGLKGINDSHGHAAGDEALRTLARVLSETLRVGDVVYRVGGDEFVVLLPETDAQDVEALLERATGAAPRFSCGVACAPADGITADELLAFADAELLEGRRIRRGEAAAPVAEERAVPDVAPHVAEQRPGPAARPNGKRMAIEEVMAVTSGQTFTVEVTLRWGWEALSGRAKGSSAAAAAKPLVAQAVLDAVGNVDAALAAAYVEGVALLAVGDSDVVIVNIVVVGAGEETCTGAARIRERGVHDAVARAVLDALNRRLEMLRVEPSAAGS